MTALLAIAISVHLSRVERNLRLDESRRLYTSMQSSTPKLLRFKDYADYADELHSGHYRNRALRVRLWRPLYGEPCHRGKSPWEMPQNERACSWRCCWP